MADVDIQVELVAAPEIQVELVTPIEVTAELASPVEINVDVAARGPKGGTGATGPAGADGADGQGVPTGGTSGQVLAKASATDYDTEWVDQSGGSGAVDSVNSQTGVVVLDADDIDDTSTTHKFVTASDLTTLSNTSGTNTGDQVLPTRASLGLDTDDTVTFANLSGTNTGDQDLSGYATTAAVAAGYQPLDADLTALAALTSPATKLNGIEAGADVTDTANVTAAGALMDSEVANLAAVKAFDPTDYATAAQGALADTALQSGDVTAATIDTEASADGYVLTSDGAGNAAWEAVSGSGTVTSVAQTVPTGFTVAGSPVTSSGTLAISYDTGYQGYTTTEASKLSNIEANADVTDATNVAAAGAVMDGDFSTNGLMKRTGAGTYTSVTDNSSNWDTAYGWGDHASGGYAADSAVVHDTGDETVAGVKTFSSFPITPSAAPTTDYQTANKKYVDDEITAAGGYNDEAAQDAIGTILTDSSEIDFTYDDATPSITASIVAGSIDETKLDTSVNASLGLADSALQSSDIANFETTTELNSRDTANRDRANHTGSQAISTVTNLQTTLDGKATSSHSHTESDITDLGDYATSTELSTGLGTKANTSHTHPTTDLTATGGTSTSYLRKDNTWATPTNTTYSEITTAEIDAGTASTLRTVTGRRSQYIVDKARTGLATSSDLTSHTSNTSNPHSVTASQVGLGNVDNTSDANKPISTATQIALDTKITGVGTTKLTVDGTEPSSPAVGDLWLDTSDDDYPLDSYLQKSSNLSDLTNIPAAKENLGLGEVNNTSDLNKPVSNDTQDALDLKANLSTKTTDANGWTVYNNGVWREYHQTQTGDPANINSGSGLTLTALSLPVGVSSTDDVSVTMTGFTSFSELRVAWVTPGAIQARIVNQHTAALNATAYRVDWVLRDK